MIEFLFLSNRKPDWERIIPFGVALASAIVLSTAYVAQYGFSLEPCILCLYQRVPYAITGILALAAILMPRGDGRIIALSICVLVFLVGGSTAFYHLGVEQQWWLSMVGCGGELSSIANISDLHESLLVPPGKSCDYVDWRLFGLSMTVYNAVLSLFLAIVTWYGITRMRLKGDSEKVERTSV